MKISFLGAAHEVTGSQTLVQVGDKNILVDCGMEQGRDVFENAPLPIVPGAVDAVVLTHAHMDHAGNLPLLVKNGFSGPIYATDPTCDLCKIMLQDSAHIQEMEAEWKSRKAARAGGEAVPPLYTMDDAMAAIGLLQPVAYDKRVTVCDGVDARFVDAGHLLGSASIELWLTEDGQTKKLACSGDIGNAGRPMLRDPHPIAEADFVLMESTYGDRSHGPTPDYVGAFAAILQATFDRGGSVIVPAFAVGRTQEFLYILREIIEKKHVKGHDGFAVYVDSPLANEATQVFKENAWECCDDETRALLERGINPLVFPSLRCSVTTEESKAINFDETPKVILSASGMCDAGRIRHHLKHNLWRPECAIVFVGYQAEGTLGRTLLGGANEVRLFGETIEVKAQLHNLNGVSGHADDKGLMAWAQAFAAHKPQRVFVNHGDEEAAETLAARLTNELKYTTTAPFSGDAWDLLADKQLAQSDRKRIEKPTPQAPAAQPNYTHLLAAANRLMELVKRCQGRANKDLKSLAAAINHLCEQWK